MPGIGNKTKKKKRVAPSGQEGTAVKLFVK